MSVTQKISLGYLLNFKESKKSLTIDSVWCVLLDQFNECEGTRSLDDLFNFKESEKSLTMDFVMDVLLDQLTSVKEQGHSTIFSILESLKRD
jgi:hypothetical protein